MDLALFRQPRQDTGALTVSPEGLVPRTPGAVP